MNATMKVVIAVLAIVFLLALAQPSFGSTEHCPDHQAVEKHEGAYDDTVLDSGTEFCIKAGPFATGVLVADGATSLGQYVDQQGIRVGNDNVPGVSYYVLYAEPNPDPTPEPTIDPEPTPEPTVTPEPVEEITPDQPDPEPIETPQAPTGDVAEPDRLADTGVNVLLGLLGASLLGSGVWLTRR